MTYRPCAQVGDTQPLPLSKQLCLDYNLLCNESIATDKLEWVDCDASDPYSTVPLFSANSSAAWDYSWIGLAPSSGVICSGEETSLQQASFVRADSDLG